MERVRGVLNCTGVVLHTGLGRAPLPRTAVEALCGVAGAATVEIETSDGRRGQRQDVVEHRIRRLFGAAGCAFNNNAAATLICLAAACAPREVLVGVSRLVAIGGSFEMPAVMRQSGCPLVEVGSVNQTALDDYRSALGPDSGAIFCAHRSNFRLEGDYAEPSLAELAETAHSHGLPLIYDQGSGLLFPTLWSGGASTVQAALDDGADLVCFSGDKLLGGPQAGIVVGREDLVRRCAAHPLARGARLDKLTLAALAATLDLHLENRLDEIPTLRLLGADGEELVQRASALAPRIRERGPWSVEVRRTVARAGSGALPLVDFPSAALELTAPETGGRELARRFREAGVFGRVEDDSLLLDLRALPVEEEGRLLEATRRAATGLT